MTRLRLFLLFLLSAAACVVAAPGAALADSPTAGVPVCSPVENLLNGLLGGLGLNANNASTANETISFSQPSYTADEDAGQYWITISRSSAAGEEKVYYGVNQDSAQAPWDFGLIPATEAVLAPGQSSCQFPVNIVNNGMNGPSIQATPYMWGSYPAALQASPERASLTILRNDPLSARSEANPLELPSAPANGDPLSGAQFYVQPYSDTAAGKAMMAAAAAGQHQAATALKFIAQQPFAYRFWYWKTPANPAADVARYLETAQQEEPGRVVELSTYSLVHNGAGSTANPAFTAQYLNWIRGMAQGIGNSRVVLFFELDSLITSPGLTNAQRHIRFAEQLKPAIEILEHDCPHLVLYLDAGASDALPARLAASDLRQAGVQNAQGFFINSTHFQWDTTEIQYGQQISRMLGGHVHFLVSSGVNGRGPLLSPDPVTEGVEQLCNPINRGLGTMSTQTGYANLDGLLWFGAVGNSGGACRAGAPPTAEFWPAYAEALYARREFGITGPRLKLQRSGTYVPYSAAFSTK